MTTREEALKLRLDNVYNMYEDIIQSYSAHDMQRAFREGIEFADNYPKENMIPISQFDELMGCLCDYLYTHNRNILQKKRADSCFVDVEKFKMLIEEHKRLKWHK